MDLNIKGKLQKHFKYAFDQSTSKPDSTTVICVHCKKQFKYHNSYTTLQYHLRNVHPLINTTKKEPVNNIATYFQRSNITTGLEEKISDAIVEWITSSSRPFSIVEDQGLINVVRICLNNENFVLPSRRKITKLIKEKYDVMKLQVLNHLQTISFVAITTDMWTSISNESFCGITCHWVDKNWEMNSIYLDCNVMEERHYANNISKLLENTFNDWKIYDKIQAIVTDSAPNMILSVKKLNKNHIPCFAHILQLGILKGIKACDVDELLKKCRSIVGHFKHSVSNSKVLEKCFYQLNDLSKPMLKLAQDIPARWNSLFTMIERILNLKDSLIIYFSEYPNKINSLNQEEFEKLDKISNVLKPFLDATKLLGGEKFITCSLVIPVFLTISYQLSIKDTDPFYIARFKTETNRYLQEKLETFPNNPILEISSFLDPRFKNSIFTNEDKKNDFITRFKVSFDSFCQENKFKLSSNYNEVACSTGSLSQSFFAHLKNEFIISNPIPSSMTADYELSRYLSLDSIDPENDLLYWWKQNASLFPNLSLFASKFLLIPASSVPCERLFSKSGYIINKTRASLSAENVNILVCLKDWINANEKFQI